MWIHGVHGENFTFPSFILVRIPKWIDRMAKKMKNKKEGLGVQGGLIGERFD